ncbi:MAG: hypothetical protein ABL956_05275 [Hyphomonadaceae bacterium]
MSSVRWRLPLLLAATICATCAVVVWLAHVSPVIPNFVDRELARQRETNGVFLYDAGFVDDADYLLLDQVPFDDRSRGGVYFIGDSAMKVTLHPWLLPPGERRLIHNYSVGALRHSDVRAFVRMLVEDFDLLRAGGEHTTIFLSCSYYLARPPIDGVTLSYYVERHGLYTYSADAGMHPTKLLAADRFVRMQRDYAARFLNIAFGSRQSRVSGTDAELKSPQSRMLEGDWRAALSREVHELEELITYLQARGVTVAAIFPPSGSWDDGSPYEPAYRAVVEPLLQKYRVALIDQDDLISDDDFADRNHPNYRSELVLHELNRRAALGALGRMGLKPSDSP